MAAPMIPVELTWFEIAMARDVARRRQFEAKKKRLAQNYSAAEADPVTVWARAFNGTVGELAGCKGAGLYWDGSVNTFHDPDAYGPHGEPIQIRTRPDDGDDLCIRPTDNPDHWFMHVTGFMPAYRIWGVLRGRDGMKDGYAGKSGKQDVWYVPAAFQIAIDCWEDFPWNRY